MSRAIDGKSLAEQIRNEIAVEVQRFVDQTRKRPRLAAIIVGDNPASHLYVKNKLRACEAVSIECESYHLAANAVDHELCGLIERLNRAPDVSGILLQLPIPQHLDKTGALDAIAPAKDVDGLHPYNVGLLVQRRARLIACTPLGVIHALKSAGVQLAGKKATVVGRSDLVGKPLALLLLHENATPTMCHSRTQNLREIVLRSEVVIVAIGRPAYITSDFISDGAVLIDVGINVLQTEEQVIEIFGSSSPKIEDFRKKKSVIVGDIHPSAHGKSSLYTPVPGGVGPLTIAMLLQNTLIAARNLHNNF